MFRLIAVTLFCFIAPRVALSNNLSDETNGILAAQLALAGVSNILQLQNQISLTDKDRVKPDEVNAGLSMDKAVEIGLAQNLDVQAAAAHLSSLYSMNDVTKGAFLPHLDVRYDQGMGYRASNQPATVTHRTNTTVTLKQSLFDEPARYSWNRQEMLAVSAEDQLNAALSSASLEIANSFLQVIQNQLIINFNNEYDLLLKELLDFISNRVQGGGASVADRERVRARTANVQTGIANAKSQKQMALLNLERLLGQPVQVLLLGNPAVSPGVKPLDEVKKVAAERNPELMAAQADISAAEMEMESFRGKFLPKLELEVTYQNYVNAAGLSSQFEDTKGLAVVTVPVLNGGSDLAQVNATAARIRELRYKLQNAQAKLFQEVEVAYVNLDAATNKWPKLKEELDSSSIVVKAYKQQLTSANRSLLDVLDAYQQWHRCRLDIVNLAVTEAQAYLQIAYLTGDLSQGAVPTNLINKLMEQP